MKQLHQQGLRSEHQEELSPAEHQQVLTSLQDMPESSYKHTMRGLIILASNWGGRECEYHAIMRVCVYRAGVAAFPGLCWSGC
jgi:hypothetical protein